MDQTTILIVGAFVLLLLIAGIGLTIKEFSKMAKEPEKYTHPAYDEDEEEEKTEKDSADA